MKRNMLKSKIHRACVTQTDLNYEGSITIDADICNRANIVEFEKVDVYNCNNGIRFSTYVISGGKGDICLNGAAARLAREGDRIIIASYAQYDENEIKDHRPIIIHLNENNRENHL